MTVSFIQGLKGAAGTAKQWPLAKLVACIVANFGKISLFEWLHSEDVAKPYFDVDAKDSETTAEQLRELALAAVDKFFGFKPTRVVVTASHGNGKLSYHIFVPGYRMKISDIKKRIVRLELDKNRPFDTAVYGSNQKFRMVGSYETEADRRTLVFTGGLEVNHDNVADTIVQHIEDDWPLLDEVMPAAFSSQPYTSSAPPQPQPSTSSASPHPQPSTSSAPFQPQPQPQPRPSSSDRQVQVARAPKRARGRPPKALSIPQDAQQALVDMQFANPRFVSATENGFVFDADNRDACPNCSHDHTRQNWCAPLRLGANHIFWTQNSMTSASSCRWCIPKPDGFLVANYSDRCVTKHYSRTVETITPMHTNFEDSLALLDLEPEQATKLRSALHYHDTVVKVACYRPECLACDQQHDCSNYTAMQLIPQHCWTVRNDDNSCRGRIFHHSPRLAAKLHSLFMSPNEESLIGLFLEGHLGTIHVARNPHAAYLWATAPGGGGRWKKLTSTEFESHVSRWLNSLLQGVAAIPEFEDHAKAIKQAQSKITPGGVTKIKQLIQGRVSLQAMENGVETKMDTNPFLLGAGTNVIDLKAQDPTTGAFTTCLRRSKPQDLVTKSVGYVIPEDGLRDTAAVEAVFAQIYPIEEERRFFQLYGGYCLLGNNPAKGFLCLTDRRKGDNGKSTAVNLLRRALGEDYIIDNKHNLLYEARYSTNVNAHDAGMLAFEGKRLAIMEELSASKALDTSVMKQLTGGEAHISVRPAGAADTRSMLWSAKLIAVFNEGCVPKFKADDDAFTKRIIVMPHRSLFCKDAAARTVHGAEEHTFDADGMKIAALTDQPWKILAWFLQGVRRYWASGRSEFQVPPACREWAGALVQEQDEVAEWLENHTEYCSGSHLVLEEAFNSYRRLSQAPVSQRQFQRRVSALLPQAEYNKQVTVAQGIRKAAWLNFGLK